MLISLALWGTQAHALGLGAIALQSSLGRPLQASIPVVGLAADDGGARCLKSRVLALDGSLLARPLGELSGSGAATMLSLRSAESINEPAVNVIVEIGCANAIRREYQLLLDPLPVAPAVPAVPVARPASPQRVAPLQADRAATTTTAAPPAVAPKRPAPARPKPAAAPRNVLTLTTGGAEIEQPRASLALRYATTLSEPRLETDPAKLAAAREDQARVAALLRGESLLAGALAQTREAQGKLQAAQKLASDATRQYAQEKAAAAAEREQMVSSNWVAVLGALLLACLAVIGWLLWRRADDRRRHEQAFFTMAEEPHAPTTPPLEPVFEPAPPSPVAAAEMPLPQQATFAAAEASAPVPAGHDWGNDPITLPVATTPPEPVDLPESWLLIENQIKGRRDQPPPAAGLPHPLAAVPNEKALSHAAEVAALLLAAESWMAEHNPLRAAELLRPYLDRPDMLSPVPGLYLLSLYRTTDDQAQIQTVHAQLKQHFPGEAADWANPAQVRRSIADFPLVHSVVDSLSETDKLLPYLNSLLLAPEQFDFSTYREIVRAIGLANEMKQESDMHSMSLDFQ